MFSFRHLLCSLSTYVESNGYLYVAQQKVYVVANRLPVSISCSNADGSGEIILKKSGGGLVSALVCMRSVAHKMRVCFFYGGSS